MKKNILLLILFICQNWALSAQKTSTLYMYRNHETAGKNITISIYLNDKMICDLQVKTRLSYTFLSKGYVKITAKGNGTEENYTLNIQEGMEYYVKVGWKVKEAGKILLKHKDIFEGQREFGRVPGGNIITLKEDPNNPVILSSKSSTVTNNTVVKTDTIKQIVYVNSEKNANYTFNKTADIDKEIPVNTVSNDLTFALIIGNEDYTKFQLDLKSEVNVDFARNDASAFKEYAIKTLGIPEKNITFLLDATAGQISQALSKINLLAKNTSGKAKLIFYYAGHGLPDENTKEPYLMPVDVSGTNTSSAIKLKDIYKKLTEFPCERITVFLDACFSGGGRNQGLVAARGVKIQAKEETLKGKMIVFSSSTGEQSSLPYKDKNHGIFTYFLLKKLQETKGNVTYKELSDYLKEKVSLENLLINNKEQNPTTLISSEAGTGWMGWKINR